jgi:hypothetical protein
LFLTVWFAVCTSAFSKSNPTGRSFIKFCLRIFRKYVETIQVWLKYDKNNGYFTWRPVYCTFEIIKAKAVPLQAWSGPEGSRKLRFPDFMTTAQDGGKVVSLTHRPPLPPGNTPGTHFC